MLRDGRGTLRAAVVAGPLQVAHHGTCDAEQVDPGMIIKMLVLGGHERLLDALGNRLDRDVGAVLAGVLGQQPAVAGMDPGRHRRLVVGQLAMVGQPAVIVVDQVEQAGTAQDDEQGDRHDGGRQQAKKAVHGFRSSSGAARGLAAAQDRGTAK